MAGRKTYLDEELTRVICEAIADGAYIETAAQAAGVPVSTLYLWLDRGVKGEKPYSAFLEAVTRARAEAEIELMRSVRRGDGKGESFGQARAAAFLLERTRPNKFAQRVNLKVEDAVREVLDIVRVVCSPEDFARICERLEAADREGGEELPAGDSGEASSSVH